MNPLSSVIMVTRMMTRIMIRIIVMMGLFPRVYPL